MFKNGSCKYPLVQYKMANDNIIHQLNDFEKFGFQLQVIAPPHIPQLLTVWQWDSENGLPFFVNQHLQWERFLPRTLLARPFVNTALGQEFVTGMNANVQIFSFNGTLNGTRDPRKTKLSLLGMILKEDLKRLNVRSEGPSIIITKTFADLLHFDDLYDQRALVSTKGGTAGPRTLSDLITEINLNSARGFMGPGTFRCREPHCVVTEPLLTQTPTVRWGPGLELTQVINIRKRCTCASNNYVYLMFCNACLEQGRWTTYVGQSEMQGRNLHDRWSHHLTHITDQNLRKRYPVSTLSHIVPRMIDGKIPDPELLLQDPYIHFRFVHTSKARRYTVLDAGFPTTTARKRCENHYITLCGDYIYNPATN